MPSANDPASCGLRIWYLVYDLPPAGATGCVLQSLFVRKTSDLAVWGIAGIPIVVGNPGALQYIYAGISPLWRSPLGPIPPDPTFRARQYDRRPAWLSLRYAYVLHARRRADRRPDGVSRAVLRVAVQQKPEYNKNCHSSS